MSVCPANTVLYIDPEPRNLRLLSRVLANDVYLLLAERAEEAYALLDEHHDDILIVMAEQRAPRVSGIAFLTHVQANYPHMTRILTATVMDEDILKEASHHQIIHHFIYKPWDIETLARSLRDSQYVS